MSLRSSAIAMLALAIPLAGCPFAMDDDYYTVSESPEPDVAPSESAALPDGGLLDAGGRPDAGCRGKECGRD
jgi:hypothetical protein